MEEGRMKVELLPNTPFLKRNEAGEIIGFDLKEAISFSAKIAGECYEPDGWSKLKNEPIEQTNKREKITIENEHHSVYDHVNITFEIVNIPKILVMILNNEKQYNTSEKSGRYTIVVGTDHTVISEKEEQLYMKWMEILKPLIKEKYGNVLKDFKIQKLAQENCRYLVTIFMPTRLIHTIPLAQLNRVVAFMRRIINNPVSELEEKLIPYLKEFIDIFTKLNVLDDRLQTNRKDRSFSLLSKRDKVEEFGESYCVKYKATFAHLADAQRHRTLSYEFKFSKTKEYFIPPILLDNKELTEEWLNDIKSIENVIPQGTLVDVTERGTYDNFILKCKERLCSAVQVEVCNQTRANLLKYQEALKKNNHPLKDDIIKYTKGARCTFPDYECSSDCKFSEGKVLTRKI
ncbi:MAG: FAD-dependent thymidylate synthase [Ignavibacteriales bacterium]